MPPRSTPTEVNEHVCLQRDVTLSEPAVTSRGRGVGIAEDDLSSTALPIPSASLDFCSLYLDLHREESQFAGGHSDTEKTP